MEQKGMEPAVMWTQRRWQLIQTRASVGGVGCLGVRAVAQALAKARWVRQRRTAGEDNYCPGGWDVR